MAFWDSGERPSRLLVDGSMVEIENGLAPDDDAGLPTPGSRWMLRGAAEESVGAAACADRLSAQLVESAWAHQHRPIIGTACARQSVRHARRTLLRIDGSA